MIEKVRVHVKHFTITNYTASMENDYVGSVAWNASGSINETGIYYAYNSDKSDAKKVSTPLRSRGAYAAVVMPR